MTNCGESNRMRNNGLPIHWMNEGNNKNFGDENLSMVGQAYNSNRCKKMGFFF